MGKKAEKKQQRWMWQKAQLKTIGDFTESLSKIMGDVAEGFSKVWGDVVEDSSKVMGYVAESLSRDNGVCDQNYRGHGRRRKQADGVYARRLEHKLGLMRHKALLRTR